MEKSKTRSLQCAHFLVHISVPIFVSTCAHFFTRTPCELLATPLYLPTYKPSPEGSEFGAICRSVRIFDIGVVSSRFSSGTFCKCLTWESVPRIGKWSDGHFLGWRHHHWWRSLAPMHFSCALQRLLGHFVFCLACGTGANSCNATLKTKRSNLFRRQCWRSVQLSYQETIKSLRSGGNKQFEPLGWLCIFPSFESAKVYFVDIMKLNCPAAKWAKSNLLMQTRNSCIEARAALACSKVWIGWNASKDPRMSILRLQGDEVCN